MRYIVLRTSVTVFLFALFDALIHGGIAAAMQRSSLWNQTVSDMYQLGFAIAIVAVLSLFFFGVRWHIESVVILILLFGFVEDTLYFLLMPLVNPLIEILTQGARYQMTSGMLFPESLSGWVGVLGRFLGTEPIRIPFGGILLINGIAILVCAGIVRIFFKHRRRLPEVT